MFDSVATTGKCMQLDVTSDYDFSGVKAPSRVWDFTNIANVEGLIRTVAFSRVTHLLFTDFGVRNFTDPAHQPQVKLVHECSANNYAIQNIVHMLGFNFYVWAIQPMTATDSYIIMSSNQFDSKPMFMNR